MAQILSCSIDLMKIDKSKLISGKNGAKYLNLQLFVNDEKDKLGNGRVVWSGTRGNTPISSQEPPKIDQYDDSLPF